MNTRMTSPAPPFIARKRVASSVIERADALHPNTHFCRLNVAWEGRCSEGDFRSIFFQRELVVNRPYGCFLIHDGTLSENRCNCRSLVRAEGGRAKVIHTLFLLVEYPIGRIAVVNLKHCSITENNNLTITEIELEV